MKKKVSKKVAKKTSNKGPIADFHQDAVKMASALAKKHGVELEESVKEVFMLFGYIIGEQDGPMMLNRMTKDLMDEAKKSSKE